MTCAFCSSELEPQTGGGARKVYCSKKCADAKRAADKRQGPWNKTCPACKIDFVAGKQKQIFCSYACRYPVQLAQANKRYADFRKANPLPEVYHFTCDLCSVEFSKPYQVKGIAVQRGVYCEDCRPVAQAMRYRLKTVKRQSQTTHANRIAHEQLAERDGLNCYLCNEVIDMALPRTSKMGATIDHVVPLSRGGLDELDNLKLAHWTCNLAKSNKLVEELNG
jgi:5-methylcytosine-specific restriction endonuclease McrA